MPAMALIRSGGLLFVQAANEGHAVVELFPREKVTEDFDALADRLLGSEAVEPTEQPIQGTDAAGLGLEPHRA